jgi:hypothetical protein
MEAGVASRSFDRLRVHSIGLPQVLFQSITHMAPAPAAVLFFFPLYYEYYKFPPTYPIKYANWVALGWIGVGIALTIVLYARYPDRLRDMDRVYVEDETIAPQAAVAVEPV